MLPRLRDARLSDVQAEVHFSLGGNDTAKTRRT